MCNEPYTYKPHEVGELTPFQVRHLLFIQRTKNGSIILDPNLGETDETSNMRDEWEQQLLEWGIMDDYARATIIDRIKSNGWKWDRGGLDHTERGEQSIASDGDEFESDPC